MREQRCEYLVFDISNLLYRSFYAQTGEDDVTLAGMACHMALMTLNKYYKQYRPKKVVMAFDRSSWRKEYTAEYDYLKPYKGNRRQDMTPAQQLKFEKFKAHLAEFERLIIDYTTIITLWGERLEADDLIAGFIQKHPDSSITVISADSDLAQLMKHSNVLIVSPATDKVQNTLEKYNDDPEYYLFHKCVRGDTTDNVQSAYPRVRSSKIKEVYDDAVEGDGFKYINFMKEKWTNQNKQEFTVAQMFKHNQVLIDLEKQPDDIRQLMEEVLVEELALEKKFSYFHILKFIGKYKLIKIKDNIEHFIPMLSL